MSSPGGGQQKGGSTPMTSMTPADAARIQSAGSRAHGGTVEKGSFAARAQSAAAHKAAAAAHQQQQQQGGGQGGDK